MNANLCPVALYHDIVHGIDNALLGHYSTQKRGDLFSAFAAYLKLSIRNGTLDIGRSSSARMARVKNAYIHFCEEERIPTGEGQDVWELHVEPWVTRKLDNEDFSGIDSSAKLFFEVSVANPRLSFELDGGTRTYPLRGRIDEIDIARKRIVERTIKDEEGNDKPPFLKDYQVWLLSRILRSLEKNQLPSEWQSVDFSEFQMVVETPQNDFLIRDDAKYLGSTHTAYAWINDVSLSESHSVFTEVSENAQCVPENPNPFCYHPFINCWRPRYDLPRSRPEIRQVFHPWYRLLLWEQIWKGHLWQYQLVMLARNDLFRMGIVLPTRVVAVQNDVFRLQVKKGSASSIRGLEHCTIIPFGTVYCGLRVNTTVKNAEGDTLDLQAKNHLGRMQVSRMSEEALIISSQDQESPVMSEPPIFLQRNTQRSLFRLKGIGTDSPEKARKRSVIQILEAIFGTRPIRREKQ
jgi:hypothetical protein